MGRTGAVGLQALGNHPQESCAGKAVGEDATFQVFGKRLAHIGLGGVVVTLFVELACTDQLKPTLEVLGYGLVEQRTLRMARQLNKHQNGIKGAWMAQTRAILASCG